MSYKITFESMVEEIKAQNPILGDQIVDYHPSGQLEVIVRLRDGSRFRYDYRTKTMSRVPDRALVNGHMTEQDWRADFAEKLNRRMYMKGLTQAELSEVTGISHVSIGNYMNGRATPSAYNIDRLCWALGCPASELVNVRDM